MAEPLSTVVDIPALAGNSLKQDHLSRQFNSKSSRRIILPPSEENEGQERFQPVPCILDVWGAFLSDQPSHSLDPGIDPSDASLAKSGHGLVRAFLFKSAGILRRLCQ